MKITVSDETTTMGNVRFSLSMTSSFFMLAINIASVVVGSVNADQGAAYCTDPDVISFSLSHWLVVGGIFGLVATTVSCFSAVSMYVCVAAAATESIKERVGPSAISAICPCCCFFCTTVVKLLFWIAWFTIGVVLLSVAPASCQTMATSVFVMAIISLVFHGLMFFASSGHLCSGKIKK